MSDQLDEIFDDEEAQELDNFLPEPEAEEASVPGSYVILNCATGGQKYVPVDPEETTDGLPGVPLSTVLDRSQMTFGPSNTYFVGSVKMTADALVTPGAVVTVIGTMKGGQA